ncbi:MAG: decarboxylating 6-phosphogluconate dehydrogenase [Polyangiales bacterium]
MQIAMVGLGKMGLNMVLRLLRGGHEVVALDRDPAKVAEAVAAGARGASTLAEVAAALRPPRVAWVMVPSGAPTQAVVDELAGLLSPGDVVVDGGNSNWRDSQARGAALAAKGLRFMDAGTSGGVWGLANGYCLMVGAEPDTYAVVEPALATLAPPDGCRRVGPVGAGHYAKMIHNGIEYGMMQSFAEGFEILKTSPFPYDLGDLAALWNRGSVVRSWLLELAERGLREDPSLEAIKGYVPDSGEGRWTVQASIDQDVPAPVLTLSLQMRFRSRQADSFGAKVLAMLRNQFGGHAVKKV